MVTLLRVECGASVRKPCLAQHAIAASEGDDRVERRVCQPPAIAVGHAVGVGASATELGVDEPRVREHVHRVPDQDQRHEGRDDDDGEATTLDPLDGTRPLRPVGAVVHNQCLARKV